MEKSNADTISDGQNNILKIADTRTLFCVFSLKENCHAIARTRIVSVCKQTHVDRTFCGEKKT